MLANHILQNFHSAEMAFTTGETRINLRCLEESITILEFLKCL
jgi:hypothetical protein